MAGNGSQEIVDTMLAMKTAVEALSTKAVSSIEAENTRANDFSTKFDTFASAFKAEVLGAVQTQIGGISN